MRDFVTAWVKVMELDRFDLVAHGDRTRRQDGSEVANN
jgi:hypothetical protein